MEEKKNHLSDFSSNHPSGWSIEEFRTNWEVFVEAIIAENSSSLVPRKRIRHQIEQTPAFQDMVSRWSKMNGTERLGAWKKLLSAAETSSREILPVCVQCGQCCRTGSPTLQIEDLELLRAGKIEWDQLITLREGEPARSPFEGTPFTLPEERIKLREKPDSQECVFLDSTDDTCTIYADRPLQCRAQACWDPAPARDLSVHPFLLRKHIFEGIDLLLEIIAEYENRCGFGSFTEAFEGLEQKGEEGIEQVLRLMSYEDHFRQFVSEKFNIPPANLELVLGRSFGKLVGLFGFKVIEEPDGGRCLVPEV